MTFWIRKTDTSVQITYLNITSVKILLSTFWMCTTYCKLNHSKWFVNWIFEKKCLKRMIHLWFRYCHQVSGRSQFCCFKIMGNYIYIWKIVEQKCQIRIWNEVKSKFYKMPTLIMYIYLKQYSKIICYSPPLLWPIPAHLEIKGLFPKRPTTLGFYRTYKTLCSSALFTTALVVFYLQFIYVDFS